MQVSEQWLREWINPPLDSSSLAETLSMLGLEVDCVTQAAGKISKVVVGHVLSVEQHPNADRLKCCKVDIGEQIVQIVCGGKNVRSGLKVAVVTVGGELPGGIRIQKTKLRGVESLGMICSASELKLTTDEEGGFILELPAAAPTGEDLRQYLQLDDNILDIDLTPNRGDCASILGVARDLGAKFNLALPAIDILDQVTHSNVMNIELQAFEACPHYIGRIITNINAKAPTPIWLQERLRRSSLRSINCIVDISNYVMLELGQPIHAFDCDKLQGGLTIRFAKLNENITLLNGATVTLNDKVLVIADDNCAQAVAGIMGGSCSSVDTDTKNIFLECAYFNPLHIFKAAHSLNLATDSSYRFERGVDYTLQMRACLRFTQLVLEICGGSAGPIVEKIEQSCIPLTREIYLRNNQIKRLLGIELASSVVETVLSGLGMKVREHLDGWQVTIPSHRFDLIEEIDLIEELARIHGYEKLPHTTISAKLTLQPKSWSELPFLRLHLLLADLGFYEVITYSFIDPQIQSLFDKEAAVLTLANPLSKDMSVMRTSLWPGLIQTLQYNVNRQALRLRIFETGLYFMQKNEEIQQISKVAGLLYGPLHELQWGFPDSRSDFFDLKGVVEKLLMVVFKNQKLSWKRSSNPALHPGQAADVYMEDVFLGSLGALHPQLVESLNLSQTPYVFEFNLKELNIVRMNGYNLISKYPAVRRDLAIVIDNGINAATVLQYVRDFAGQLLKDVMIFDIYQGKNVEFGKKSVAIGLIFQNLTRTLVDQEISDAVDRVVSGLEDKLKATLRA